MRLACLVISCVASAAFAQWDPFNGDWSKADDAQIRVMTWNVQDCICSSSTRKFDSISDWNATVRIVAAMRPDVLILQETGDNSGNGTGSGVDSVSELLTTLDLFLHGGNDPFNGNTAVTSYVQKFAPDYDLPHLFVSATTDGFNRNVVLSRHPFADLDGDGTSQISNPIFIPDEYAPGGSGGIRGFQFAEIDLPDGTYEGDLVVGNAHLKSGGTSDDQSQRLNASRNIAYLLQYQYNGNGTGSADPNGAVIVPSASNILDPATPVVLGGDWNEDESSNGRRGPAEWMTRAEGLSNDGTDRDGTDAVWDSASNIFNGDTDTRGASKLDYLAWQDSIATGATQFIFDSRDLTSNAMPPEFDGFPITGTTLSGLASDHLPVIVDFDLPLLAVCPADWNGDTVLDIFDVLAFLGDFQGGSLNADITGDGLLDIFDVLAYLGLFEAGC
ncbi:MAG: hypothetical protein KDA28_09080 [Phycisphaerales bacterium]|nr:hypothetical protein [Phycisphaerales bacterium]